MGATAVATGVAAPPRLTLQCEAIGSDTTTIRSLDWDRSRFDIEFGLRNGTTYNSFLVRGERTALIDSSRRGRVRFRGESAPACGAAASPAPPAACGSSAVWRNR